LIRKVGPLPLRVDTGPWVFRGLRVLNAVSGGRVGKQLDRKVYPMPTAKAKARRGQEDYGFTNTTLGQIFALGQGGSRVLRDWRRLKGLQVQYVVSDVDGDAHPGITKRLAARTGGSVLRFAASQRIGHARVLPESDRDRITSEPVAQAIEAALQGRRTNEIVR
jgi:hypothetical protein